MRISDWSSDVCSSDLLANALTKLGVKPGDRIGTLAWNTYRHMELYYGVSGMGAVLHTVNPRLFPEQIDYIANHAEDQYLFFDLTFAPLVEKLAPLLKTVKGFVLMTDKAHMPAGCTIPNLICYEELIGAESTDYAWPDFDELTASSLRSEEHTSELQSLMRISYAVFCLKKNKRYNKKNHKRP